MHLNFGIMFFVYIIAGACMPSKKDKDTQEMLKCFRITKTYPFPDQINPGKIKRIDTTVIDYYFYGSFRAYRIVYEHDIATDSTDSVIGFGEQYLVHHKDSLYGRLFDLTSHVNNLRVRISAVSNVNTFADLQLGSFFDLMHMKLVSQKTIADSGILHEKYQFENKTDSAERGLLFLSYTNNINDIPFHLSPYMDSIKHSKLNYYSIISFGGPVKNEPIVMDTLTASVKLDRLHEPPEKEKVMKYISTYIKPK